MSAQSVLSTIQGSIKRPTRAVSTPKVLSRLRLTWREVKSSKSILSLIKPPHLEVRVRWTSLGVHRSLQDRKQHLIRDSRALALEQTPRACELRWPSQHTSPKWAQRRTVLNSADTSRCSSWEIIQPNLKEYFLTAVNRNLSRKFQDCAPSTRTILVNERRQGLPV